MTTLASSNITSGFIDLATFDELEKYLYGGPDATVYFVRQVVKSTWFTQVPITLNKSSGTPDFGQEWSAQISRSGDYLLNSWLRVTIPSVQLVSLATYQAVGTNSPITNANVRLRWTRNLMHNLVKACNITFNDLEAAKVNSAHLDFWQAFTTPAGKSNGYKNMIGDTSTLTSPTPASQAIPSAILNLPLPLFFARDSGCSLPTAALPYNEMRINFNMRPYTELLVVEDLGSVSGQPWGRPVNSNELKSTPVLSNVQVWATYAIVSNDERKRMGCAPRDILIEQVQMVPNQTFTPATTQQIDIRFSHAVKALFFGVRNSTNNADRSNYTCASYVPGTNVLNVTPSGAFDPIEKATLRYEGTERLSQMGSDYFSLVCPWYTAPTIPLFTGFHLYSYSLDFACVDPKGSTNFGKLTNVSITPYASQEAVAASATGGAAGASRSSGVDFQQSYTFELTGLNNNIVRVSGGALGFPVL